MTLSKVTPLLITFNEEDNIHRTLDKLYWASRIVVIDSGSTDSTLDILNANKSVEIYYREFDSFANQCNYGLSKINTEWVLSMDADYVLTDEFIQELSDLLVAPQKNGYYAAFKFCVFGKPLRADNTSPRQVLYKVSQGKYLDDGHQHKIHICGDSGKFKSLIFHDDRKPLSRWLKSQDKYLTIEAEKICATSVNELDNRDRLRNKIILAPIIIPFYCLFYKALILDGWHGIYYTMQRSLVELLLSIKLIERKKFY